jgi:RNA polymerase sigma factor (TIGR02999 family)
MVKSLEIKQPMSMQSPEITQMLVAWSNGDPSAFEKLAPLVSQELHRLAKRYMARERPGHTLQATALVNEAYLRLIDASHVQWQNRAHFFAVSAQVMRHILVDFARSHQNLKHGGDARQVTLDEALVISPEPDSNLVAIDDALKTLAELDPRQSQVVELRFFGGLSLEETAEVLKVSVGTVRRDWTLARAWLHRELSRGRDDS